MTVQRLCAEMSANELMKWRIYHDVKSKEIAEQQKEQERDISRQTNTQGRAPDPVELAEAQTFPSYKE